MAIFTITADLSYVGRQLRRIADCLEQLAPPLPEAEELKPEDAVTYSDDETLAAQEQQDIARELGQQLDELEEDAQPEGFGQGDIAW